MAGIYIHIPFCKRRCLYCDFFSTTQLERMKEYVNALITEITLRKDDTSEPIHTIYIGGGTPSVLPIAEIERILQVVGIAQKEEITIELNPGDASIAYLRSLREIGITRLSIGIQSFQDSLLKRIGRRHNAQQAIEAVKLAQAAGFNNISIDLMYALPGQSITQWKEDIETALGLHIQHISSYGLIYEQGTALTKQLEAGIINAIDEEVENEMYDYLCQRLQQAGYVHYEVSNFALPGYEARHNSNYWNETLYIGIGAGSHSLLQNKDKTYIRSANPSDLDTYIQGVLACNLQQTDLANIRENDILRPEDVYNERIMLGLRTNKGIMLDTLFTGCEHNLSFTDLRHSIENQIDVMIDQQLLRKDGNRIVATQQGIHILNQIIEKLMIDTQKQP